VDYSVQGLIKKLEVVTLTVEFRLPRMLFFDVNVFSKAAAQNIFLDIPGAQVKKRVLQGKYLVEFFMRHSPGVGRAALCYVFFSILFFT
jgi:hypothetical protein